MSSTRAHNRQSQDSSETNDDEVYDADREDEELDGDEVDDFITGEAYTHFEWPADAN